MTEFEVSARIETPQEVFTFVTGGFCNTCCASSSANARNTCRLPLESRSRFRQPDHDGAVDEGSIQSFPASDPASYTGSTKF